MSDFESIRPPGASGALSVSSENFDRVAAALRTRLHRYLSRMTGSVIEGEDVLQETLSKALQALPQTDLVSPDAWLFRIAQKTMQDFLKPCAQKTFAPIADAAGRPGHEATTACLRAFVQLPPQERSAVILRDVLGYSMNEIAHVLDMSAVNVKAALQHGRARLKALVRLPEEGAPPEMDPIVKARLANYIAHFNAREFDALRAMLAEEVRVDLINRLAMRGTRAREYFTRYEKANDWRAGLGLVDSAPAILIFDPHDLETRPNYFILLDFTDTGITAIRDFRYARYAVEDAQILRLG